jgi:hypothetical protein
MMDITLKTPMEVIGSSVLLAGLLSVGTIGRSREQTAFGYRLKRNASSAGCIVTAF